MPAPRASTSGIAISYRRADTSPVARRLVADLGQALGEHRIHADFATLSAGEAFEETLARTLVACSVQLVLIGPGWLTATDDQGRPRLHSAGDWVRAEVATALRLGLNVIPVLVDGATMPRAEALPDDLQDLAAQSAFELSSRHWRRDLDALKAVLAARDAQDTPTRVGDSLRGGLRALFGAPRPAPQAAAAPMPAPVPVPVNAPAPAPAPRPAARPAAAPGAPAGRDIFISYAFEDEAWAQRVVQALEPLGYACWVASRDIVPGTPSYAREITRAIRTSRLLIVLLSEASNESDDVLNEITLAKDHRVPRLPLRIDDAPLGDGMLYFFSQAQRLDGGALSQAAVIERLTASVRQQLGASGPAAAG